MAAADYHLCDQCGAKTFYDAVVEGYYDAESDEWLYGCEGVRGYRAYALCEKCEATHEIVIVSRDSDTRRMAETGTGSVRSTGSAVPNGQSPNPIPSSELDALVERQFDRLRAVERALANGADYADDPECHPLYPHAVAARQVLEKEITSLRNQLTASEARGAAVRRVRDGYADQAKFADPEPAAYFREFVRRLDAVFLTNTENHQ